MVFLDFVIEFYNVVWFYSVVLFSVFEVIWMEVGKLESSIFIGELGFMVFSFVFVVVKGGFLGFFEVNMFSVIIFVCLVFLFLVFILFLFFYF